MKRIITLVWAILFAFVGAVPGYASGYMTSEDDTTEIVNAKRELVAQHSDEYIANFRNTTEGEERQARIVDLICRMQTGELDSQTAIDRLEENGVYRLETDANESDIAVASEPGNVKLNNVTVTYDSYNDTWIVSGGGYWLSDAYWRDDTYPYIGIGKKDIGDYDAVGISLYNTSGTYNTRIIESYGYCSSGVEEKYNYNPTICDGRQGAVFEYQDMINNIDGDVVYLGERFAAVVVYDADFTNFNGYARAFYLHTWSSAVINEIGFGSSDKTWQFNVSITNEEKSFSCYSSGETRF